MVTEVQHRSSLSAVRSLSRAGVRVVAVGPSRRAAGALSRYPMRRAVAPDPGAAPAAHRSAVAAAAGGADAVVYPGTEAALDACLAPDAGLVTPLRLPYPRPQSLAPLRDKLTMASLAEEAGWRAPEVLYAGPASGLAAASPSLPCIVKPSRPTADGLLSRVVSGPDDLAALAAEVSPEISVLAQELVDGQLMSAAVVVDAAGRLRAEFHQASLRLWPAGSGSSSRAMGVEPDPQITERLIDLLQAVGYAGLAQVDYIRSARGPVLLDVNPRFYASMPLALASGVNLPSVWHSSVCGAPYRPPTPYRPGVTFRWLEADLSDVRHGDWRALRPGRAPRAGSVWDPRDPLPSVAVAAQVGARIMGARLRRSGP